jgi:hypothetical protein
MSGMRLVRVRSTAASVDFVLQILPRRIGVLSIADVERIRQIRELMSVGTGEDPWSTCPSENGSAVGRLLLRP